MSRLVIVGAGLAGCQLAASLREKGFEGDLVLLGDEDEAPYQRPPLSKSYLAGSIGADALAIKSDQFFADHDIQFRRAAGVLSVQRRGRSVTLRTGETLGYDRLVLATGVRSRMLAVEGADRPGVFSLRTRAEATELRAALHRARRVAVVGAGFIGMEFAAVARQAGLDVTVIEQSSRSMSRAVSPLMSAYVQAQHMAAGIHFEFATAISGFEADDAGAVSAVRLQDGRRINADLILVAIGVVPNVELAEAAELETSGGILVDRTLTTSDSLVHAIGDCASFPHKLRAGDSVRLESVQNAADQARFLAEAITGGATRYDAVPWFWSDQLDMKLQIAGLVTPRSEAEVVGDSSTGSFSIRHSAFGRLTAVETMNGARAHMLARAELKREWADAAPADGGRPIAASLEA